MATTRTRKTAEDKAAAEPGETTEPAEDKAVPDGTVETKTPDVAPLEPPDVPEPPKAPDTPVGPEGLVPAQLGDRIVDEATGEAPADLDGLFESLPPYGYMVRSRVRLVEHVGMGTYRTPTSRLLVPAGADLKREDADRILARLREQRGE
ncbi:hypothetical protein SAM9427_36705 (plasmid) [Streptomyces sp. ETH9427]|uniref:hypothetical protein n=1 Tax=Streptomyces sp. E1N211 TaxID=1851876 RepID=UPI000E0BBD94|nr:hypothetical protein [Streptomyces sp. E1N211]AXI91315.1 hypothetical protein SAM9427_36705 [Streptomyces sp. ETH9427]